MNTHLLCKLTKHFSPLCSVIKSSFWWKFIFQVLSRAFRNRFVELHFDEIPSRELETILHERCQIPASYCRKMVATMLELQVKSYWCQKHADLCYVSVFFLLHLPVFRALSPVTMMLQWSQRCYPLHGAWNLKPSIFWEICKIVNIVEAHRAFYHRFIYIAISSNHSDSLLTLNLLFKVILWRLEVVFWCRGENSALFKRLIKIHSNLPILLYYMYMYGFKSNLITKL